MTDLLRVTRLGRTFGTTTVLDGVDLSLERGGRLAVLGASGSGKTTLLRLIAGLEAPTRGEVVIEGRTVSRAGTVIVPPERRGVALMFQGLALFPHLRALDQITFAAHGRGGQAAARNLLDRVGLGHRATARLDELSGGERQRVALARALAQAPKLLLMDEPFESLDDEKRGVMRDLLGELLDGTETTLMLVTHARDDALRLARDVLVLERGKPVAAGAVGDVMLRPGHAAAVRALGLGQLIDGVTTDGVTAATPLGDVILARAATPGPLRLFVRPGQLVLRAAGAGVAGAIVALETWPPERQALRWVAVVRVAELLLRVPLGEGAAPRVGERLNVGIDGACETVDG